MNETKKRENWQSTKTLPLIAEGRLGDKTDKDNLKKQLKHRRFFCSHRPESQISTLFLKILSINEKKTSEIITFVGKIMFMGQQRCLTCATD